MAKIQVGKLAGMKTTIEGISKKSLNGKIVIKVRRATKEYLDEIAIFESAKNDMITKYGKEDPKLGGMSIKPGTEEFEKANEYINDLGNNIVDITPDAIVIKELVKALGDTSLHQIDTLRLLGIVEIPAIKEINGLTEITKSCRDADLAAGNLMAIADVKFTDDFCIKIVQNVRAVMEEVEKFGKEIGQLIGKEFGTLVEGETDDDGGEVYKIPETVDQKELDAFYDNYLDTNEVTFEVLTITSEELVESVKDLSSETLDTLIGAGIVTE